MDDVWEIYDCVKLEVLIVDRVQQLVKGEDN